MNKLQLRKDHNQALEIRWWIKKEKTGEKRGRWSDWEYTDELAYHVIYAAMDSIGLVDCQIELEPFEG